MAPAPEVEAYRLWQAGRYVEALPRARAAVEHATAVLPAHGLLATIHLRLGQPHEAEAVVAHAETLQPGVADAYDGLAYVCMTLGAHERANRLYRRAAQASPDVPRFAYNLACSERSFGRLDEAEALCDRSIALDATQYPSYLLRAELKVQTPASNHVSALEARMGETVGDARAQFFLGYALAKELDDLQQYDRAFAAFSAAARARRSRLQYEVAGDEAKLRRIIEAFPGGNATRPGFEDSSRFVFIVGLPRSGTTLVERILTGLAGVRSNGETENFSRSLLAAAPPISGDVFERAAAADPAAVGAGYARRADLTGSNQLIVEKLPLNYLYLGAIRRALPQATLLCIRRDPLDSCFAMYRTLFGEAYPFSYDFQDLIRYYRAYAGLMDHWNATLEGLHVISYEELVREPARVGAGMAAACGLAWDSAALDIQRNAAVSLTASAAQVRRPIYGTSSGRWRHYQKHLRPLIEGLR